MHPHHNHHDPALEHCCPLQRLLAEASVIGLTFEAWPHSHSLLELQLWTDQA